LGKRLGRVLKGSPNMNTPSLCCTLVATLFLATAACKGDDLAEPDGGPQDGAAAHDGGGDAIAIPPDAFAVASLQPGTGGICPFAQQTTAIEVGVQTGTRPSTVSNGASQSGAQVKVACTVHRDNNGYDAVFSRSVLGDALASSGVERPRAPQTEGSAARNTAAHS
jgi:hypothetical protein